MSGFENRLAVQHLPLSHDLFLLDMGLPGGQLVNSTLCQLLHVSSQSAVLLPASDRLAMPEEGATQVWGGGRGVPLIIMGQCCRDCGW